MCCADCWLFLFIVVDRRLFLVIDAGWWCRSHPLCVHTYMTYIHTDIHSHEHTCAGGARGNDDDDLLVCVVGDSRQQHVVINCARNCETGGGCGGDWTCLGERLPSSRTCCPHVVCVCLFALFACGAGWVQPRRALLDVHVVQPRDEPAPMHVLQLVRRLEPRPIQREGEQQGSWLGSQRARCQLSLIHI